MNNIIEIREDLEKMPLFHFSLNSKELFHSNFWTWLILIEPKSVGDIFLSHAGIKIDFDYEPKVAREYKNLDLVIEYIDKTNDKNVIRIVIENKTKSLPYKKQLEEYKGKLSAESYLLVSLSKPYFDIKEISWKQISYENFVYDLEKLLPLKNDYHNLLLEEYIKFLKLLCKFEKLTELKDPDEFNFYDNEIYNEASKIRIDDLYLKKVNERFVNLISDKIKKELPEIDVLRDISPDNIKEGQVILNDTMVRSKAVAILYYEKRKGLILGIEINGYDYNKTVWEHGEGNTKIEATWKEILETSHLKFPHFINHEVYNNGHKGRKFKQFGENFRYWSIKLNENPEFYPIQYIMNSIISDLKTIKNIQI